ncbi:MAG: hypothetical protein JWQ34_2588 [Mucilaginibacter sp.]|nr:hypothetical protein [Mucilaginibacter sp.]MDB5004363.1 hypothetical protein [Mucilaginibacter sp.]
MSYIIIEAIGGAECAIIVTDENGSNLIFDTKEEAEIEATDCQDCIIVEI